MKKNTKYFFYFILIAPILAKIVEWIFQIIIPSQWIIQLLFIEFLSLVVFFLFFYVFKFKKTTYNLSFIVGIAYFLKELFNLIFVIGRFNMPIIIALTFEPIFMYTILGVFLPKLFFKELRRNCR